MEQVILDPVIHHGNNRLLVRFKYINEFNSLIKKVKGSLWSSTLRCWHIPDTEESLKNFQLIFKDIHIINHSIRTIDKSQYNNTKKGKEINDIKAVPLTKTLRVDVEHELEEFRLWLQNARYSDNTVTIYFDLIKVFFSFYMEKSTDEIEVKDITRFNNEYILRNGYSSTYQNQVINAIKLFYKRMKNTRFDIEEIVRPRREHKLPNVLSKEEVGRILNALSNCKHRTMLSLIYACGLRRGELLRLRIQDVDSKRKLLIIYQSKGKKDRVVPISEKIIDVLREYYKIYRPEIWLFEGQQSGEPYSEQSLQKVLKKACYNAHITKPVSLHWLRHSYATHLHEAGTDIRFIQELLGHKSSRTTEIYTHVSTKSLQNIRSPFDDLF